MAEDGAPANGGQGDNPSPENQNPGASWYGDIQDTELKGWLENKGAKSVAELANSYRSLERVFGADKAGRTVMLPKDDADETERNAFFSKLGRPESPDKYEFQLPENADKTTVDWFKTTAHKHGLSSKQAQGFLADYQEFSGGRLAAMGEEDQTKLAEEHATLDKTWGAAKDQKLAEARAAVQEFGLDQSVIEGIEKQVGYAKTMQFFASIGAKLGEGKHIDPKALGGGGGSFAPMTPEQALATINQLKDDKDWMSSFLSGDAAKVQRMDQLHKWAYGHG